MPITVLVHMAQKASIKFMLNNHLVDYDKVFALDGFLPGFVFRANQLCLLCLGYGLGVQFDDVETSTLQYVVIFDYETPNWLRYLFIMDVLYELLEHSPQKDTVFLDEFLYV